MRKILFISTMILLSLQIQAQRPINATFVIIRDSLCMKNGGGDSCVTVIMNDTLVNTTWVRNLILAYDSILHAQYADSAKYADSSGFADTSYFSLNVGAGGSPGDVQYNNAGVLDGAPMTTDGSNMEVSGNLVLDYGFENILDFLPTFYHEFTVNPIASYPFYFYAKGSGANLFFLRMGYGKFLFNAGSSTGQSYFNIDHTGSPFLSTRMSGGVTIADLRLDPRISNFPIILNRVFISPDSLESEFTILDTSGFHIEIDGDIDNPDPQYNFEKDSMWITTKLVQPQTYLQFYTSSPLSEPILSADTYQTIEGMSVSGFNDVTYTDSSVTVPAKAYGLYTLNYSVIVQTGTNNTVVHAALFKNDVIIPSTERSYSLAVKDLDREISATVGEILTPGDVLKLKIEADLTATLTINHIGVYLKRE